MLSCAEPHPPPTTYHQPTYADLCRPVPTRADLCRPVPTCALPTRAFRESAECPSTNTDPPPLPTCAAQTFPGPAFWALDVVRVSLPTRR